MQLATPQQGGRHVPETQSSLAQLADTEHVAWGATPAVGRHANTSCPSMPTESSAHDVPLEQSVAAQHRSTHTPSSQLPERQSPLSWQMAPGALVPCVAGLPSAVAATQ